MVCARLHLFALQFGIVVFVLSGDSPWMLLSIVHYALFIFFSGDAFDMRPKAKCHGSDSRLIALLQPTRRFDHKLLGTSVVYFVAVAKG